MNDIVGVQVCQSLQQGLGKRNSHVAFCVLVRMADAVIEDVTLANVLLHYSTAQHNTIRECDGQTYRWHMRAV